MATNPTWYDSAVEAAVNAVGALLDNGYLEIYTGSQPALDGSLSGTLLAQLIFGAAAFAPATASGGTVTAVANAITSATAGATGTAAYFALVQSNGTSVVMTGTVGTSGCDLNGPSTAVSEGVTVTCSSFQITEPQT